MKKLALANLIALLALAFVLLVPDTEAAPGERERRPSHDVPVR